MQEVAVIATVLNEAEAIGPLLTSLAKQSRLPDELVIVDGGSTDGTLAKLESMAGCSGLPLKVLSRPGSRIAQGRNAAIAATRSPLIAVTDAGVRLEEDWLAQLLAPFESQDPPDVVSGVFRADPHSTFELALGATTLPMPEEIDPQRFYPSSRSVAFRRAAWDAVGGYPEWLDYCEDLLFDFALRDTGFRFAFAPKAVVHFRPRRTLGAFFRQYYRYARGDGKADFWRLRHLLRYVTYLVALPLLVALAVGHRPLWLLAMVAGLAAMMRRPFKRLLPHLRDLTWREGLLALCWVPVIRVTGDVAKMLGYPVGVWWRWHHAPSTPWPRRQC